MSMRRVGKDVTVGFELCEEVAMELLFWKYDGKRSFDKGALLRFYYVKYELASE